MSSTETRTATPPPPSDPIPEWPLPAWDRYLILGHLGAGGAGRVFKAWDPRLRRNVAIKILHSEDIESMQRFLREARTQAQLTHPNICQVYEADMAEDHPYIVMQLIEGRCLQDAAREMTISERVSALHDVATALAAAHQVNLIHRDIKPSNIMVERHKDGTWHPYLLDFGLSRNLSTRDDSVRPTQQLRPLRADSTVPLELTELGHVVGTPAFMAPEQARGDGAAIGEPSDVFSLGATMYAILGGHPPFTGATQREILERVVASEPAPLEDHSREIPRDLAAVVMRCLAKDPNQRYPAAAAVAADLWAFLRGYPVSAVRPTLRYVAAKAIARRPFLTAVLVLVIAAACTFGSLWIHARWSATQEALVAATMGHRVAEAKSYLWKARSVPLHDIRPHIAEVRKQMASIRAAMASAGGTVRGAGHQALGEAHLELDELEEASHHLRAAWESGYRTTEGAFAMARTVGGLYRNELAEVEHIREARLRQLRFEEIRSRFGDELMTWWRRIEDSTGLSHQLLEAMVASHEGRTDEALQSCATLIAIAPWIYEAHLISGDLHLLQAAEEQPMSDVWLSRVNMARSSFGAATQLAPSDLRCHLGRARTELFVFERCETPGHQQWFLETVEAGLAASKDALLCHPSRPEGWELRSRLMVAKASLLHRLGQDWHPTVQDGIELAEAAVTLQPEASSTHQCLGDAYVMKARLGALHGEDVERDLEAAIATLGEVVRLRPSHTAHQVLGVAWRRLASCRIDRGRAGIDVALRKATESFADALEFRPDDRHTLHNLGRTEHLRGQLAARRGHDPLVYYQRSRTQLERSISAEPEIAIPHNSLGNVLTDVAKWRARTGHDPSEALQGAVEAFEQAMAKAPQYAYAANNLADVLIFKAGLDIDRGRDPSELLQRAHELLDTALTWRPGYATPLFNRAVLQRTRARHLRLTDVDPIPALESAAEAFARGLERRRDVAEAEAMLAEIYLEKARVLAERGETQAPALRQYQAWIRNALEHDPSLAAGWRCVLAGALFRLEQVVDDDAGANDAIAEAESALREARRIDPTHPELLRSTARLRLYMARSASAQRRSQLLQDGLAQLNPLIDRDVPDARALLVAAHLLLAQGGDSHRTDASVLLQRAISINPLLATEASTLQGKCSN